MSEEGLTFEEAFHQLEEILDRLEEGSLDLEESLTLFERGMALARRCEEMLDQATLRVEQLMINAQGNAELSTFG